MVVAKINIVITSLSHTHSFTHSGQSNPSTDAIATEIGCLHTSIPHSYNLPSFKTLQNANPVCF